MRLDRPPSETSRQDKKLCSFFPERNFIDASCTNMNPGSAAGFPGQATAFVPPLSPPWPGHLPVRATSPALPGCQAAALQVSAQNRSEHL